MFPLLQLFLLILGTVLGHMGSRNPNLSSADDCVVNEGFGSSFVVFLLPNVAQILMWSSTLYQALYLYFQAASPASISTLFPQISIFVDCLPLTPISLFGYVFLIVGGGGRIWCYRTLGKFFTFELTIRNSHKLIRTGPYAYVRHPSYTFGFIALIGVFLIHRRLANFFPHRTWIQTMAGPVGFLICCMMLALVFKWRVSREEEELGKTFGKEWTEYVSKTKRFIPRMM